MTMMLRLIRVTATNHTYSGNESLNRERPGEGVAGIMIYGKDRQG